MNLVQYVWPFAFAVGSVQGFFLGTVLLFTNRADKLPTYLLAVLVLCTSFLIGEEFVAVAGLAGLFPHAIGSTITIPLLVGPLLFMYAQCLTGERTSVSLRDLWHALPFLTTTLYLAPFFLAAADQKALMLNRSYFLIEYDSLGLIILKAVQLFAYLFLALWVMNRYIRRYADGERSIQLLNVIWSRRVLYLIIAAMVCLYILLTCILLGFEVLDSDNFGSLFMSGFTYLLAFIAIKFPSSITGIEPMIAVEQPDPDRPRYQSSSLEASEKEVYRYALLDYMTSARPFEDPQVRLEDMADALRLTPHHLSQIINEMLEMNFNEFVNTYRVEAVKDRMRDPARRHIQILALAFESGFNSKTTFNRIFKQNTGMTPSQYRRRYGT